MNSKLIALLCLLGGLLAGYKLGSRTVPEPIVQPPTPSPSSAVAAIARPAVAAENPPAVVNTDLDLAPVVREIQAALSSSSSYQRAAWVAVAIRAVPPARIPELMELLRGVVAQSYGYTVSYVLLPIWGANDPTAAMEFARSLGLARRQTAITSVIGGWVKMDLEGALAYVNAMPFGAGRTEAAKAVVSVLSEQDPARAMVYIKREKLGTTRSTGPTANLFSVWGASDPQGAAAELLKMPAGKERDYALRGLARAWAKTDPNAALAFVRSLPNSDGRRYAYSALLGEMTTSNPAGAANAALSLNGSTRLDSISAISTAWAKTDLNGVLAWATSLTTTQDRDRAMRGLAPRWAETDPVAAAAFADGLPMGSSRSTITSTIVSTWSQKDPAATLDWLSQLPPSSMKNSGMYTAVDRMANSDPVNAAGWLDFIPSESSRRKLSDDVAQGWARTDPDAAMAWASSLELGQKEAATQIVRDLGSRDPQKVAAFVAQLPDATQLGLMDDVARAWATADPVAARQWTETLPEGRGKTLALTTLIGIVTASDPSNAATMALALPDGSSKNTAILKLATSWAGNDSQTALAWLETLPGGEVRDRAVHGVISGLATQQPQTAAEYVAGLPAGKVQDSAALSVISRWAATEPAAAAGWAAQFPEGKTRGDAMNTLMSRWGRADANAASQFLGGLPEGESRARAIESFVNAADSADPRAAAQWVTELGTDKKNLDRIEKIGRYWMQNNPAAATAWLSTSGLSADRIKNVTTRGQASGRSSYGSGIGSSKLDVFR
jgi:hypothetical protein